MNKVAMEVRDLPLQGLKLIRPQVFHDERGFFKESYRKPLYEREGIICDFVQDNHSFSHKGTVRGMHFQRYPGQSKLIWVASGTIYDVAVDIRSESPTFGKWEGVYLDANEHQQYFIPSGFAHGFCVVSESAHVIYKVSSLFDPVQEKGFRYDDPEVGIVWPEGKLLVSTRDLTAPSFKEAFK